MAALQGKPRLIKSYETDTRRDADELYIQNAAFSYDNALAALAFISDGKQELKHVDDWKEYLHVVDRKLALTVDSLFEALEDGVFWF